MTDVLDAILLQDSPLRATLSMDKQNCGYLGCISGWLGALRGSPGSQIVDLGCRDTEWVGGNDKNVLDAIVPGRHHTSHFEHEQRKLANLSAFLLGLGP